MRITRSKAIRLKCIDCCNGQTNEVKLCPARKCPLWLYRLGYEVDEEGKRITRHKCSKTIGYTMKSEVENDGNNED